MSPRFLPLRSTARLMCVPPWVVEGWVASGQLTPVLFVDHGRIVRGVPLSAVVVLVDARRAAAISQARDATTVLCSGGVLSSTSRE